MQFCIYEKIHFSASFCHFELILFFSELYFKKICNSIYKFLQKRIDILHIFYYTFIIRSGEPL